MTFKFYERYGPTGLIRETAEVNWKNSSDTSEYYESPIIRPSSELDQTCSFVKYNYFRVLDLSAVVEPEIVIVSPYLTKAFGIGSTIQYAGSGRFTEDPVGLVNAAGSTAGTAQIDKDSGEIKSVNLISGYTGPWQTVDGLDIRLPETTEQLDNGVYEDGLYKGLVPKRVTSTRLYYRLTSEYNAPDNLHDWDMIFAGLGNVHISVPLLSSPTTPYTSINTSYTGIDLYTPYIATQLRTNESVWDDVGNSPQYKLMLKCKIFK